ncbi:V(D)J recombination-activating protein 1-like [Branchiostoma lanceolatum]|uniref:V(D)J recombination-activating protein 1-like n=1 Tax=Branchiostoma lanceolatum TaxID=7740 RepID=UPI0034563726
MSANFGLEHVKSLSKLCRFCGESVLTKTDKKNHLKPRACIDYVKKIQEVWNVNVENDKSYKHPPFFCHRCKLILHKPPSTQAPKRESWYPHWWGDECVTCKKVASLARGGRTVKKRSPGRPKMKTPKATDDKVEQEQSTGTAKLSEELFQTLLDKLDDYPYDEARFEPICNLSAYTCGICQSFLYLPIETPCAHIFCFECIQKSFEIGKTNTIGCAICKAQVMQTDLKPVHRTWGSCYTQLTFSCKNCSSQLRLEQLKHHLDCNSKAEVTVGPSSTPASHTSLQPVRVILVVPPVASNPPTVTTSSVVTSSNPTLSNTSTCTSSAPSTSSTPSTSSAPSTSSPSSSQIVPGAAPPSSTGYGKVTIDINEEGPLTAEQEDTFTALYRRKAETSTDKGSVLVKTGGQVWNLFCILHDTTRKRKVNFYDTYITYFLLE